MSRSPFQRFIRELRRRHVPQTAAIYLVAAWAAIEFADVVVPNLNGPQWIVPAVIIAALVGFPVLLVVAWIFEWGPEGIHRTEDAAAERMEAPPAYQGSRPEGVGPRPAERSRPWVAALAVLVVGIGSAVGVAYVLTGGEDAERTAPTAEAVDAGPRTENGTGQGRRPPTPAPPELEGLGAAMADSIQRRILRSFGELDSLDLSALAEMGREAAAAAGVGVMISEPAQWRIGSGETPAPLQEGDTLAVEGVAFDSAGITAVTVNGDPVVEPDPALPSAAFTAELVGRGSSGIREVVIVARTADGREIQRVFSIIQLPSGTP